MPSAAKLAGMKFIVSIWDDIVDMWTKFTHVLIGGSKHHRALLVALGLLIGLFTTQARPTAGLALGIAGAVCAALLYRRQKAPRWTGVLAGTAIGVGVSLLLSLFATLGGPRP